MRKKASGWLLVATALGLAALGSESKARADQADDASGTWTWQFTGQEGRTVTMTLVLDQEGDTLSGTITGPGGRTIEIEQGRVKDGTISFQVTRERDGQKRTSKYRGKLKGDTIEGTVAFEVNGEARTRDWEAKRSD